MGEQDRKYRELLVRFAKGEVTREQVRAADPLRKTLKDASKLAARGYLEKLQTAR